jgi:hypothetical protein
MFVNIKNSIINGIIIYDKLVEIAFAGDNILKEQKAKISFFDLRLRLEDDHTTIIIPIEQSLALEFLELGYRDEKILNYLKKNYLELFL